jgi:hypothetical protein
VPAPLPGLRGRLYSHRNPGEDVAAPVSTSGRSYSELPNAFSYRKQYNAACQCRAPGQSWADALQAKAADQTVERGDIVVTEERAKQMSQPRFDAQGKPVKPDAGRRPRTLSRLRAQPAAEAPAAPAAEEKAEEPASARCARSDRLSTRCADGSAAPPCCNPPPPRRLRRAPPALRQDACDNRGLGRLASPQNKAGGRHGWATPSADAEPSRQRALAITRRAAMPPRGLAAGAGWGESAWPDRAITLVHGLAPGGPSDIIARIVADGLTRRLGQAGRRRRAAGRRRQGRGRTGRAHGGRRLYADGHSLRPRVAAALYKSLPYRTIDDFSMISLLTEYPFVVVTYADHPIRTFPDLIDHGADAAGAAAVRQRRATDRCSILPANSSPRP